MNKTFLALELGININRVKQNVFFFETRASEAKLSEFNKATGGEVECDRVLLAKWWQGVILSTELVLN